MISVFSTSPMIDLLLPVFVGDLIKLHCFPCFPGSGRPKAHWSVRTNTTTWKKREIIIFQKINKNDSTWCKVCIQMNKVMASNVVWGTTVQVRRAPKKWQLINSHFWTKYGHVWPTTRLSFTKLRFGRSFWDAEQV